MPGISRFSSWPESRLQRHDLAQVPPRYRSSYFLHIWASGYAAGYYAYLWTQMLADDAFAWFTSHGGLTRENGDWAFSEELSLVRPTAQWT